MGFVEFSEFDLRFRLEPRAPPPFLLSADQESKSQRVERGSQRGKRERVRKGKGNAPPLESRAGRCP